MKLRTPLSRVRGLGAAHEGTDVFWVQRLTSIASIPLTFFLVGSCLYLIGADYETARAFISSVFVAPALMLVVVVFVWHMSIGMEEILIDYVHSPALKFASLISNILFCVFLALTCIYAILKLCFGA
ncbi:MAG: succinate dehydrogenase, hydrophobic membrane anchor protein [Methyloligellaceae bacterium]